MMMIIMMNFTRRSSRGHHGSKRRELAQHAHSTWIAPRIFHSRTYIDTVTSTLCEAPALLLQNLEYNCICRYLPDSALRRV